MLKRQAQKKQMVCCARLYPVYGLGLSRCDSRRKNYRSYLNLFLLWFYCRPQLTSLHQGLTAAEVQNRLAMYGPNSLKEPEKQVNTPPPPPAFLCFPTRSFQGRHVFCRSMQAASYRLRPFTRTNVGSCGEDARHPPLGVEFNRTDKTLMCTNDGILLLEALRPSVSCFVWLEKDKS